MFLSLAYIKGTLSQLFPHTCSEGDMWHRLKYKRPSYRFQKYLEKEVQIYTSLIVREDAQLHMVYQ